MTLEGNIWKLGVMRVLRWALLIMPTIVLFFQENGLTLQEIFILQSLFAVAIIIFEIPSGYFSDVLGRKKTLVISSLIASVGFIVYSFSYGFWGFLLAELLLGLGGSFMSGTDSALLYDTLVKTHREKEYTKIEGRLGAISNFSEGAAAIIGALLATITLRTPLFVQTGIVFLTIPLTLSLVEPVRKMRKNAGMKDILNIVSYALHGHPRLKWLIIYGSIIGASTLTLVWLIQPFEKLVGVPIALFGVVWAALNFSVGLFAWHAHRIEKIVGRKRTLISLSALVVIGFFALSYWQTLWALPLLLIFYLVRGVADPVFKNYINTLITSDMRATVLSVKSMGMRLLFAIIGPFVGWIADVWTLSFAFITSAIIFVVLGGVGIAFLYKHSAL